MDNKTGKYIKYALGEILLVMIGILLALQVNNWNEQRNDRKREQVVLKQLQEDFQANLMQLEEKMETREKILISALELLTAFDDPAEANRDSVIKNLANTFHDPTYDPIQNDLTSSDNLILIRNNRLKRLLSNLSSDVVGVIEIEQTWTKSVNGEFGMILSELGLGRDVLNSFMNDSNHRWLLDNNEESYKIEIGTSKLGAPLNEVLTNRKLEGILGSAITLNKAANLQSEALHNRIQEILDLIQSEIKD
jgi:type II secretory pathway pseudopilin PulG